MHSAPWAQRVNVRYFLAPLPLKSTERYKLITFGDFLILHYFQNCDIKNTGFIHFFCRLLEIIPGILVVSAYTQIEPGGLKYDIFLVRGTQIRMYFSQLWIHII